MRLKIVQSVDSILANAEKRKRLLEESDYEVTIIKTNEYPLLDPNLWAVVMGPYTSRSHAEKEREKVLKIAANAYIKQGK